MRKFRKPMQRSTIKADPVSSEVRAFVLARDGACVAALLENRGLVETRDHICRDQWGTPHDPRALSRLSLEHVKDKLAMSKRAKSDPAHLLAVCYGLNIGVPSKTWRAAFRAYLREVPTSIEDHSTHIDPCSSVCRRLSA